MFGAPIQNGLTLTKVISGLSKTLSIAGRVIPLYKEAKPMINNAKTILSTLKEMNTSNKPNPKTIPKKEVNNIKKDTQLKMNTNNPTFFL